jgi:hypothetical protein
MCKTLNTRAYYQGLRFDSKPNSDTDKSLVVLKLCSRFPRLAQGELDGSGRLGCSPSIWLKVMLGWLSHNFGDSITERQSESQGLNEQARITWTQFCYVEPVTVHTGPARQCMQTSIYIDSKQQPPTKTQQLPAESKWRPFVVNSDTGLEGERKTSK